jgi:hypothetical protein
MTFILFLSCFCEKVLILRATKVLMKRHCKIGMMFVVICMFLNSCKTDNTEPQAYALPQAQGIVVGNIVSGTNVNNSNLSGNWQVQTTTAQYYDLNKVLVSNSPLASNFFSSVILNDKAKTAGFENLADASNETYILSTTTGADLYIQLPTDPFPRSSNSTIQITNLTATSMTWVATDPRVVSAGGQILYNAYQVVFTKQ